MGSWGIWRRRGGRKAAFHEILLEGWGEVGLRNMGILPLAGAVVNLLTSLLRWGGAAAWDLSTFRQLGAASALTAAMPSHLQVRLSPQGVGSAHASQDLQNPRSRDSPNRAGTPNLPQGGQHWKCGYSNHRPLACFSLVSPNMISSALPFYKERWTFSFLPWGKTKAMIANRFARVDLNRSGIRCWGN